MSVPHTPNFLEVPPPPGTWNQESTEWNPDSNLSWIPLNEVLGLVGLRMSLVWISKPVFEEEAMSLSIFVLVSSHVCVVCRHFWCPVSLFQGHVACQKLTQTWPLTCSLLQQPFLGSSRNALPFSLCGKERCVTSLKETINRGVTLEDRYRRQVRNFTTNVWKILDLKSSSEQIFSENWCWVPLRYQLSRIFEKC